MNRLAAWLTCVLLLGASVQAQFLFPEGRSLSRPLPNRKRSVQADVTLTITHASPWGPIVLTEKGRYWRDTKGHTRMDTAHGISYLRDDGRFTFTIVDHRQRRIYQEDWRDRSGNQEGKLAAEPIESFIGIRKRTKSGTTTLEGIKVSIYNDTLRDIAEQQFYSSDLQLPILLRMTYPGMEMVQRFENIRQEKPDPALFELPSGYAMRIVQRGTQVYMGSCRTTYADKASGESKTNWVRVTSAPCLLPPEPASPSPYTEPPLPTDAITSSPVSVAVEAMQGTLPLEGLSAKDFVLRGEGTRRPVRLAQANDPPLDIVVIEDNMRFGPVPQAAGSSFHALRSMRPRDRVALVVPGLLPRVTLPFTNDRAAVEAAINDVFRGGPEYDPSGIALRLSVEYATRMLGDSSLNSAGRRRVILMFGGSLPPFSDEPVLESLAAAGIAFLFVRTSSSQVALHPVNPITYRVGDAEHVARATGGSTATSDSSAMADLLERQRRRYVLEFDPPAGAVPGQTRRVSVELSEEARRRYPTATVNARELYIVP